MTPHKDKEINTLIDTLKQFYDEFKDVRNPVLKKQKLEFDLFYNEDLRYRKICFEIEEEAKTQIENLNKSDYRKYMTESNKIYSTIKTHIEEREQFNTNLHRVNRTNQIHTSLTWFSLFIGEKAPIQQSATMFKITSNFLENQLISLQRDIRMDNKKLIDDLSEEEEMAFNFNMARPFKEHWTEQQVEILKLFKSKFEGIPLDLSLIDKVENRKSMSKNKCNAGFNLGYSEKQLETLNKKLIEGNFLDRSTQLQHFKNAFNGEVLAEGFKPLKWTNPTMGAVFFFCICNKKPQWKKYSYLFEPANYKQLLSQSRGNGTFDTLTNTLQRNIL